MNRVWLVIESNRKWYIKTHIVSAKISPRLKNGFKNSEKLIAFAGPNCWRID